MQMPDTTLQAQSPQNGVSKPVYTFGATPRTAGTMPVWTPNGDFAAHLKATNPDIKIAPATPKSDGPSFKDFIDIINPLQHLPIIGHIYRHVTGDEISPVSRFVGGALFGGFIGAGSAIASMALTEDGEKSSKNYTFGATPRMAGKSASQNTLLAAQTIRDTPLA